MKKRPEFDQVQKIDPEEYQKRLDRITEIFAGMVTHADDQASSRCPYRDRHDRCTAKFRCGNQTEPSPGQEQYQCGHDGLFDYRPAWESDPETYRKAQAKLEKIQDEAAGRRS